VSGERRPQCPWAVLAPRVKLTTEITIATQLRASATQEAAFFMAGVKQSDWCKSSGRRRPNPLCESTGAPVPGNARGFP
jgi:hypothetical protein